MFVIVQMTQLETWLATACLGQPFEVCSSQDVKQINSSSACSRARSTKTQCLQTAWTGDSVLHDGETARHDREDREAAADGEQA